MRKKLSKRAKNIINISVLVVLIGITLTVLMLSYRELSFRTIWDFLAKSNAWYIVAAVACMLLFIMFEGLSVHVIARKLGHKSKLRSSIAYSAADTYYSALTPSASGGQPASLFYMVRDGMSGGVAGFTLILNLIAYTVAIVVIGAFALIVRPQMILQSGNGFALTLVILGLVVQFVLAGLLLMCMLWSRLILKAGNGGISLLVKMKIVKKPEKWRSKLDGVVEKYRSSKYVLKKHPAIIFEALFLNIAQRVSQTLIPCFVCFAADPTLNFLDLFCMQAYVVLGYNFIPLPGGVGAYEYLYDRFYGSYLLKHLAGNKEAANAFMVSAMMVSRTVSYYLCIIVSGLYTLVYHGVGLRKNKVAAVPERVATDGIVPLADESGNIITQSDVSVCDNAEAPVLDTVPAEEADTSCEKGMGGGAPHGGDFRDGTPDTPADLDPQAEQESTDTEEKTDEVHE